MKHYRPGATVPDTGIYWCTVCKLPKQFTAGDEFPACTNMCGRGQWEAVVSKGEKRPAEE